MQPTTHIWMDGEMVAGLSVGWNFGDGHLHGLQLLDAIQEQCGFEPGELRVVMVESQPLGGSSMAWKIADAATGVFAEGETKIADMIDRQPWPTGREALAFVPGRASAPPAARPSPENESGVTLMMPMRCVRCPQ